ncbi:hypothetical protein CH304_00365 [Rhodococcus sp. 15-649-1-2]|nr:hypothetical protein CH304_00365 [Rhodococcus sp. 15-649-1-2]
MDATNFLLGNGIASAKFEAIGTTVGGVITEEPEMRQQTNFDTDLPDFWPDGKPKMQLVVTVQTDLRDPQDPEDDGQRRFYVRANLQKAVAAAVRKAKATALEVGGTLQVTYSADGPKSNPKFNAPKIYTAVYTPPAANFLADTPTEDTPAASTPATTTAPAAGDDTPPPGFPADAWASLTPEAKAAMKNLQNK